MNRAQAPDELDAVDANDFVSGKMFLEDLQCQPIVLPVPVYRHKKRSVDEVKVDVGGGEPLAVVLDHAGHGDLDDPERLAILIAKRFDPPAIFFQNLIILILFVRFDAHDDRLRVDESGQVVDMAVGVVASDAVAEPGDVLLAVVILEILLDLLIWRGWGCGSC